MNTHMFTLSIDCVHTYPLFHTGGGLSVDIFMHVWFMRPLHTSTRNAAVYRSTFAYMRHDNLVATHTAQPCRDLHARRMHGAMLRLRREQ